MRAGLAAHGRPKGACPRPLSELRAKRAAMQYAPFRFGARAQRTGRGRRNERSFL